MAPSGNAASLSPRTTQFCAGLIILLALLSLVGWITGVVMLASFRQSYIPMAPSTALCFLFSGLSLLLAHKGRRWLPCIFAVIILAVAWAKIIELIAGLHFGIDEWLVRDPVAFGKVQTGRMSPITAFNFCLLANSILFLTSATKKGRAGLPATIVALISAVVLMGYLYGTPLLYGGAIIPVALTTTVAFLVCAVALLVEAGPSAWPMRAFLNDSTHALLMRRFLPTVVGVIILSGWIHATLLGHALVNPAVASAFSAILLSGVIAWIITHVSASVGRRIDAAEAARNQAQAELRALNANLEQTVRDRTRELGEKNSQMTEELDMARELQLALLPQNFPSIPTDATTKESAVSFLTYYFPSGNVSGDFFSVIPVTPSTIGIFICDVMGHGVRAALVTSMLRALIEEHARAATEPGELLARVNRGLVAILSQAQTTMYATGFYLLIDVQRRELAYATAGHPSPIIINHACTSADPLPTEGISGPALGIFQDGTYGTRRRPIAPGDRIMLFTDGLFEVENAAGEMFNEQSLLTTVRTKMALPSRQFFDEVLGEVRRFSYRNSFDDDVCLVGIEVHNLNGTAH